MITRFVKIDNKSDQMVDFVAIDFETADGPRSTACAVGCIRVINSVVVEKYFSLIKPINSSGGFLNNKVHQISSSMVQNADTFDVIYIKLLQIIGDMTIVAHNVDFDKSVFDESCKLFGLPLINNNWICTYKLTGLSLKEACARKDIQLDHHDPLSDAIACGELFLKIDQNQALITKEKESPFEGRQRIKGELLKIRSDAELIRDNPFKGKKVVISGIYRNWPDRILLAKLMQEIGADIDTTIGSKTDYLIIGNEPGPSKITKMKELINKRGTGEIIDEDTLLMKLDGQVISEYEDEQFYKTIFISVENGKIGYITRGKLKSTGFKP